MPPDQIGRSFFETQVSGLLDNLYGVALRLTRNRADAEDLAAECIAKAWAHFDSLQDRQCFRGWIFRILTNTFLSECRKRDTTSIEEMAETTGCEEEEATFSIFERLHVPFLLWWSSPEQDFLNKILREDLEKALDALPEIFRVVVVLNDLQGFTYQEIAGMLDIPVGTVRSRLSRARSILQKTLWQQAEAAGLALTAPATQDISKTLKHEGAP